MDTKEKFVAFAGTELGALVIRRTAEAVNELVARGEIENTEEAKSDAYGVAGEMIMQMFVAPNLGK